MKRYSLLIAVLLISLQGFSQEERPKNLPAFDLKRLHFGFTVGFNAMDMAITRNYEYVDQDPNHPFVYADVSKIQPGFQVSIVSDLRLSQNWNLRFLPGISFGSRDLQYYTYPMEAVPPSVENPLYRVSLGPSFLDFPLLFKYRSDRVNNYRPYLVGGANFRYDMSAKRRGKYDVDTDEYVKLLPGDLYFEFGFGLDTYLKYFKFAPELKLAVGLLNIIDPTGRIGFEEYTTSVEKARSFIVMLNFHFE
ncbi:MAG: PorT family protein [Bacteroidetes bacterium]|nr:PorT family protein [Bacteroidota bacterium]